MDIREDLSRRIMLWLEKNPNETLQTLAKKSSISVSTLRRIERMEVSPSLHNTAQLLAVVASTAEAREFLDSRIDRDSSPSRQGFRDDMSQRIADWLRAHPRSNLQMLAQVSRVPFGTLHRISIQDLTATLEETLQLLEYILPLRDARDFLRKHFPDLTYLLRPEFAKKPQRPLRSREEFLLHVLAMTRHGINREMAERRLGENAACHIEEMLQAGLLTERKGLYCAHRQRLQDWDQKPQYLTWMLELFDPLSVDAWGSLATLRAGSLSPEGIKEVHLVLSEARQKVECIVQNPVYFGSYVMGFGLIGTLLGPREALEARESATMKEEEPAYLS